MINHLVKFSWDSIRLQCLSKDYDYITEKVLGMGSKEKEGIDN